MNNMISTTILILLIMDPLGNLPIFMSILKHLDIRKRQFIIIRELCISLIIMMLFLFTGEKMLMYLNLRPETVSISGGLILFLISIKMIFSSQDNENELKTHDEPFLVPLAIPLLAGPSLLATLILLSHKYTNQINHLIISLVIAWIITAIILLLSNLFLSFLNKKGVKVLERLMGLILIMLAIQMFLDGIGSYFKL